MSSLLDGGRILCVLLTHPDRNTQNERKATQSNAEQRRATQSNAEQRTQGKQNQRILYRLRLESRERVRTGSSELSPMLSLSL